MEATARPWAWSNRNWRNEEDQHKRYIVGDIYCDGDESCDVSTAVAVVLGNPTSGKIADANADLIVRAVNAHADLLAACKALPLDCDFTDAADFKDNSRRFLSAMELARAAIAKAESAPTGAQ